jgi:uncharacterized repeat protein (TIGR02543 family)
MKKLVKFSAFCAVAISLALTSCTPEPEFKVTFDSQGGSEVAPATVKSGKTVAQPANPTKANYVFAGWYKEKTGVTAWNFADDKVTADITLYAKWTADNPNPESNYSDEDPTPITLNLSGTGLYLATEGLYSISVSDGYTFIAGIAVYSNAGIAGVYPIDFSEENGTALASSGGNADTDYPSFVMMYEAGNYAGSYYLVSGTVTITAENITVNAKSYYGSTINITAPISEYTQPTGLQAEGAYWGDYYENGTENYTLEIYTYEMFDADGRLTGEDGDYAVFDFQCTTPV